MDTIIRERLKEFEKEKGVKVWLAVESGSRAWGFSSTDSDYDVRFVYAYPTDAYLQMRKPKDTFNWMDEKNNIDYEGLDIYKYFDLLWKSNMNMIDWVFNPHIYIDNVCKKKVLQYYIQFYFNRQTYIAHNYGLCKKNYHKYFEIPLENEPTAKRYVYCIRALLSAQYCHEHGKIAPIDFWELVEATVKDEQDKKEIQEMVETKKKTKEKQWYRNPKWQNFIQERLNTGHLKTELKPDHEVYYRYLNGQFLEELELINIEKPAEKCEGVRK